jgi:uncharacterized iron-regulated membrane protein
MGMNQRIVEMAAPASLVGLVAGIVFVLPRDVLDLLTAWTLLSLPIGIVIGHFALSED